MISIVMIKYPLWTPALWYYLGSACACACTCKMTDFECRLADHTYRCGEKTYRAKFYTTMQHTQMIRTRSPAPPSSMCSAACHTGSLPCQATRPVRVYIHQKGCIELGCSRWCSRWSAVTGSDVYTRCWNHVDVPPDVLIRSLDKVVYRGDLGLRMDLYDSIMFL